MEKLNEIAMKKAIEESKINLENGYKKGGPFGSTIVKDGEIICSAHNTVIESHDPTAHAEVNAIRKACKKLNTHDLSDCVLYTSAEPCPMCLSAIIWSNIKVVYYANTKKETDEIGFRDDVIYEYLKGNNDTIIEMHHMKSEEAIEAFRKFKELDDKKMY